MFLIKFIFPFFNSSIFLPYAFLFFILPFKGNFSFHFNSFFLLFFPSSKMAKAMKTMKAKRVSVIAKGKRAKALVFRGDKEKTCKGLKKIDLMKNKKGKIVTKKMHAKGLAAYENVKDWIEAVQIARKVLGIKGFRAVKRDTPLYLQAKIEYAALRHEQYNKKKERFVLRIRKLWKRGVLSLP